MATYAINQFRNHHRLCSLEERTIQSILDFMETLGRF